MPARHLVGIGDAIIADATLEVFSLAHINDVIVGIPHQIDARTTGGVAEKSLTEPAIQRSRVGQE